MQIFLSKQCESLTGSLGSGFGYHIQKRKNGFFSKRNTCGLVPPDGHWRFILACADIAKRKLHITDIQVHWLELSDALYEAGFCIANSRVRKNGVEDVKISYNAEDIINLKTTFGL